MRIGEPTGRCRHVTQGQPALHAKHDRTDPAGHPAAACSMADFFFGPCHVADLATWELAEVPMRIVAPHAWQERIAEASLEQLTQMPWVYTSDSVPSTS